MQEIRPGVFHWTRTHEKIRIPVHSYYVSRSRVLIDPMLPREGLKWFREHGEPAEILLTNRHHYRHSGRFAKAFGTVVRCHRAGLHEFTQGEAVESFDHGDDLAGGILALEVGALCPEETALLIPGAGGGRPAGSRTRPAAGGASRRRASGSAAMLALGDSVIRDREGKLSFVPDDYMGDDPADVKRGLRRSLRRLLEREFGPLLLAHGDPVVEGGKAALERFMERRGR